MKWFLKGAVAGLACWGMMVPQTNLLAAEPVKQNTNVKVTANIADVTLHKGGIAAGQVVDSQGNTVANLPVSIRHEGKTIVVVKTRKDGTWVAKGLRGGLHQVAVGRDQQVIRLWSPNTAPPTARKLSTLVVSGKVIRGQDGYYYDPGQQQEYPPNAGYADAGYVDAGYADGACCPPDDNCGGGGWCGGLDVITVATVGASAAALVYAIDNNNKLDDLQDRLNFINIPQSP
jgi:hypothetical protein